MVKDTLAAIVALDQNVFITDRRTHSNRRLMNIRYAERETPDMADRRQQGQA